MSLVSPQIRSLIVLQKSPPPLPPADNPGRIRVMRIRVAIAFGFLSIGAMGQVMTAIAANGGVVDLIHEPFSCDAITTLARTLPDGTHIARQTMTVKMYRDSEGRTRSDRIPAKLFAGQPAPPGT